MIEEEKEVYLTVNDVCNILRVKHNKVYRLIREKKLRASRINGHGRKDKYNRKHWRIKQSDLIEFIRLGENKKEDE